MPPCPPHLLQFNSPNDLDVPVGSAYVVAYRQSLLLFPASAQRGEKRAEPELQQQMQQPAAGRGPSTLMIEWPRPKKKQRLDHGNCAGA